MATKKLIEVALPLEKINEEAEKEKQIRHGHPSNLHQYWARRPFTTARAIIWASLVDDPSSHPERFPSEESQNKERKRLFNILGNLVEWGNSNNNIILNEAKKEILKSTDGLPPALLDPFAGGGAIPMEAQRLGLESYAYDLNPVAVMINKAMIEIPPKFSGCSPVNPDVGFAKEGYSGATGLANDVSYYGKWIANEANKRIGDLYPKAKLHNGKESTVISWIWTRTVKCPNPACGCEMPLAKSFTLCSKKGKEEYVEPVFDYEHKKITYSIRHNGGKPKNEPKMSRGANFKCIMCGQTTTPDYVKEEAVAGRMSAKMMAVVAEGSGGRVYLAPDVDQVTAADVEKPSEYPRGTIGSDRRALWTPIYGLTEFSDLFTNRQLTALVAFSELVGEAQKKAEQDAINAGLKDDHVPLSSGGTGAMAYGQAVGVYLAFVIDKMTCLHSNLTMWKPLAQCPLSFFSRQGIPMSWDYAEANPFSNSSGSFSVMLDGFVKSMEETFINTSSLEGHAEQKPAQIDCGLRNVIVSTDPPYYDNIGYADLSDFFYVWMRQSLRNTYPTLFQTLLVPKTDELIASPYRHEGSAVKAKDFFEDGMLETCRQLYKYVRDDIPLTIYYAYKQSSTSDNNGKKETSSSGWETMLTSIVEAGFSITGTWPVRTERAARTVGLGTNALASSIVLVCRKRPDNAPQTTRRNLIAELRRELRPALKKLQQSNIAPVDLAQAAIGPGMSVFSKYRRVLEADGTPMTVRSAQLIINEEVDMYFNEQVGSMDTASRFCVDLYTQNAYNDIKYGEAEVLANAKGTSIPMMASHGILFAKGGIVHLVERKNLPEKVDTDESNIWLLTQQLTYAMEKGGVEACAKIVASMFGSNAEDAKDLAYRLYTIAEQKKWANEAFAYNALVVAWPDIQSKAAELKAVVPQQMSLFDYMDSKND